MQENTNIREAISTDYQTIADIYNEYITLGNSNMEETLKTVNDIAGWTKGFHDREKLFVFSS